MLQIEEILKKVKRIEIKSKKAVKDRLLGEYRSSFKGRGIDFKDVRKYEIGDDFRSIDWNVTARSGELHTRQYCEEREQTIVFAVDISASMNFGTTNRLKNETVAELVAYLSFAALMNNDRVGLILFSKEIELYLPPKKKTEHVLRLIRELLYYQPKYRETDYEKVISQISKLFSKKVLLFFCSDFINFYSISGLKILSKRHDLNLIIIRDPLEEELKSCGFIKFMDSENNMIGIINTSSKSVQKKFLILQKKEKERLEKMLNSIDSSKIFLRTKDDILLSIEKFFKEKSSKIR